MIEREIRAPASSPMASFDSSIFDTGGTVILRYCSPAACRTSGSSTTTHFQSWAFDAFGA